MNDLISVYCDESCHLEKDVANPTMVVGAVWGERNALIEDGMKVKLIRSKHDLNLRYEFKWTKISKTKLQAYIDLVDILFDSSSLFFRAVVIPDKSRLRHQDFGQTHDDWYYKMFYTMLKLLVTRSNTYHMYADYKDTWSFTKCQRLADILRAKFRDHDGSIIGKIQPVRSHESDFIQLCDVLLGAVSYAHRTSLENRSGPKKYMVAHIEERLGRSVTESSTYIERKFNTLVWSAS